MVFSLNALFTKPAQSLAPVFAVSFLNVYGYKTYTNTKSVSSNLVEGMQLLTFFMPCILGGLQFLVFKPFSLGNRHVHRVNVM